ncbi:hypothetical protein PFFVO_01780 [Plasmodium falciparum Vietnam Oak-Knoll (FVO)]|uniref:Trs120/TRAPPC9 first Ig-like domain-containing protein n=1 Tax=Plasmodium falciparum Vietnam Oak-Knoll (FVO) TaxID=1036723 RepID=A0A024V8U8_PLAFA|nr:hypothetical protein PFFVO_01780 [Plasmodium falciparum Vietnam Oak-Knoll (FVO)]
MHGEDVKGEDVKGENVKGEDVKGDDVKGGDINREDICRENNNNIFNDDTVCKTLSSLQPNDRSKKYIFCYPSNKDKNSLDMIKPFQNNNIINRYRDNNNNNNNIKEKDDIYYYHIGNLFKDIYIYRIYECFLKPYNIVNMNRLFEFCSRNICCESIFSINNHMNKLNIYKKNKNKYNAHIQYNILTFICSLLKEINYIDEYIFCNFLILLFLYKFLSKEKQKDILYTIYDSLNKKKKYIYFPPFITLIMDERRKKKQRKYLKKLNNETKTFNKNNLLFCFSSLSSFSSSSQKENLTSSSEMLTETTSTTSSSSSSSSSSPSSSSPSSDDDLRNCLDPFELGLSDTYHNKSTNSFSRNYSMKKKNSTQEKEENKLHFLSGITEGRCAPIPILVNIEYADNNCGNEKVYMKVGKSSIERINNTKEKKDIILNGNNYVDEKSFDKDKKSDNINEESHNTSNNINIYNDENVKECSEKEDCKMNNTYKDVFKYNPFNEEEKNVKIQNMCSVNEIKNVVITLKNNLSVNLVLNNVTLISSGISIENYPSSIILLSKKKNNKLNKVQLSFKAKETGILFILGISYCISYYYFDQYLLYNTSALRRCFMKNEFFDHYNDNHKTSHEKDKNTSTFKKETGNVNDKSCLYGYISDHNYMHNKHLNNMSTIQRQSFSSHKNNNNNKNNISSNNTFYCADHVNNSFYYFEDMHKGTSSTIYKRAKLLNYIFKVSSICSIFVIDDYFSLRSEIKLFNFSKYINIKELLDDHSYLNKYVTSKNNEKKKESNIECNNIYLNHITKDNSHVYHLYDKHNNSVLNNTQTFKNLTQGQVISNKYKEMYDNNDNNDNINSNDDICYHTLVSEKLDNNVHDLKNEPICMTKNISNDKKDIKCNNQNGNKETDSMTTKKSLYKKQHVFNRFLLHKRSSSKRLSLSFSSSVLSSKSTLTFTGSSSSSSSSSTSSSSSSSTSSSSSSSTSSSSSSSTSSPSPGVSPLENIHPEDLDSHTNDHSSEPLVLERKKQIRFQALYRFKDNVKKKGHKKYPHIMEGVNDDHIKNKDNISYNKEYEDIINDLHNNLYFSYDARFAELLEGEIKFLCLILENKGNMDIEFLNIKINYKHKNINGDYFIKFFFEKAFYIKNEDMHSMVTNNNNIQNEKMMSEKMVNEKMVNEENIIRINKGENLKVKKNSCLYIPIRCIGSMLINECYLNIFYSPYKDSIYYAEQKIKLKINVKKNISIQNIFYFPYVSFNYLHILNKLLNSNYYETNIINILGTIKKRERTKYIPSTEEQENRVYNNYYNGSSDNIYNNNYLYHDDNMCNTFMTKEGLHSQNNKIVKNILKLKKRMKNTIIRDDILYNMNDNNMQLIQNFEYMNKIYYEYKENLNICTDNKYIFLELYIKNHSGYVNYCKTKKLKRRPTCIVDKENNCSKWLLWIKRIKRDENLFFENEEDILNYFLQYVDCNVYLTYSRHKTVGLLSVYGSYLNSIHLQNKTLGDFFWNVTKAKIQKSTIQLNNNICDDHNGWDDHNIWDDDEKKNKCSYYQEKRETDFLSNTLNFPTPFKRHEENKNGNKDNNDLYNTYHVSNIQDAQDKNEINKSDICMKKSSEINEFIEKDNYDESHNNISLNLKNNAQYLLNVNKLFEKNFFNDIFYPYILIIPRFFHCKKKNSVIIPKCSKILDMHNYKNIGIKKKYFQSKVNQTFHVKIYLKNLSNIELGKYTLLLYPSNLKSIKIIGSLNKTEYLLNNNHLNYNNTTNMLKCKKPYLLHSFSIYSLFPGKVFFYITIYLHTYNTLLFHHEPILITIV